MKKFCVAALIILIASLGACVGNSVLASPKPAVNAKFLEGIYDLYNNSYFDGNLPRNTAILYAADPDGSEDIGDTVCSLDPRSNLPMTCTIYINPYANRAQPVAIATMIHEICHIATLQRGHGDGGHDKDWQNCMLNVAKEGGFEGVW